MPLALQRRRRDNCVVGNAIILRPGASPLVITDRFAVSARPPLLPRWRPKTTARALSDANGSLLLSASEGKERVAAPQTASCFRKAVVFDDLAAKRMRAAGVVFQPL